jgi:hypothetical protein
MNKEVEPLSGLRQTTANDAVEDTFVREDTGQQKGVPSQGREPSHTEDS